jgi:hypothetical protein
VKWGWYGKDDDNVNGFKIFVNGREYESIWTDFISPDKYKFDPKFGRYIETPIMYLPTSCGETYKITMAAHSGAAYSRQTPAHTFEQPPCPVMAEVKFYSVKSNTTSDGSSACDQLSIHYELFALGAAHSEESIWGGTSQAPHPYQCGIEYDFVQQLGAKTNTIIVPIDPNLPEVRLGTLFWDGGTTFGRTGEDIKYPYAQWSTVDEDFTLTAALYGTADVTVKGHIRGFILQEPQK